jgi:hypothetical protein
MDRLLILLAISADNGTAGVVLMCHVCGGN